MPIAWHARPRRCRLLKAQMPTNRFPTFRTVYWAEKFTDERRVRDWGGQVGNLIRVPRSKAQHLLGFRAFRRHVLRRYLNTCSVLPDHRSRTNGPAQRRAGALDNLG